jgi:hypothetical protein
VKRLLWTQTLTQHYAPPWPCPACTRGILALVPKSLVYRETAESRHSHGQEDWDPEQVTHIFTAWLKCNHPTCGQEVVVSGIGGVETQYDPEENDMSWSEYFVPKFCCPMPDMIELPARCPNEVKTELRAGFTLFFSDQAASASRVRVALERLMDHLGVQKRRKGKNGKFVELTLHNRIEVFEGGVPAIGSELLALKWLGNTGSHEGQVSRDDVLDAFEILEHALAELIDRRTAKVAELARKLTKKHTQRRKR